MKKTLLEADIQRQIIAYLRYKKCYPIRMNSGATTYEKTSKSARRYVRTYILPNGKSSGLPDIFVLYQGKLYYIEVKRPDGELTDNQKQVISDLEQHQIQGIVAYSFEEAKIFIDNITKVGNG